MSDTLGQIPLDPALLQNNSPEDVRKRIRRIVRSVSFELLENNNAFRIHGPDLGYHLADPHLPRVLKAWSPPLGLNDVFLYHAHQRYFDLCFEDCWSGYFITKALSGYAGDIVLLHLDDHTDMMPTLLAQTGAGLMNPVTARVFDPHHPADWISAIKTGCISIGDFITPLFHSGRRIHVRHLNNASPDHASPMAVSRAFCSYPEIPGYRFATLTKEENFTPGADGSYLAGQDPFTLFEALPAGKVILHIDLDYFINDFNGNVGTLPPLSPKELYLQAQDKLASFLKALTPLRPRIELKIVATSPGFCCALHWNGLLQELRHGLGSVLNESGAEAGP